MSNLLSNAASGLASGWRGSTGSVENEARAGVVQDLIDPKQVAVFDALKELSGLKAASKIEIPQLIVVGDQSTGKSSVLEAIGRFHFPVAARACTQFPTKLILRRSSEEHISVSIQPAASRNEADRERLESFREQLSNPEEFPALVDRVRVELGVPASPINGSHGSQEPLRFVEDVLVVRSSGPELVQVDLVDLPGLFTAETQHQDGTGMKIVDEMVRQYIRSKNSLVLLVVSVATSFANQAARAMIQEMAKTDCTLKDRVIGVMTNPDRAVSVADVLDALSGSLDHTDLRHRWLVVKNQEQDQQERRDERLDQRDGKEARFFLSHPKWNRVPKEQWGINALRATLRVAFLRHTQAALPGVITEVEDTVKIISARLDVVAYRSSDYARRQYLSDIARKFAGLTREACLGTYQDEKCKELHNVGQECRVCARFFPALDDKSSESQDQNLRANIRLLSKAFAFAMQEFGKTKEVVDSIDKNQDSKVEGQPEQPHQLHGLLDPGIIAGHYTFDKPEVIDRKALDVWLADRIPHWRSREPQGEASENTYHLFFEHQSKKWAGIALKHLDAVWMAIERFINLALEAACLEDHDVRAAIRDHLTQPALENLKRASHRTMINLLNCHARGKTGFFDGFMDIGLLRQRTRELSRRLGSSASAQAPEGKAEGASTLASQMFKRILTGSSNSTWVQTSSILANELVRGVVLRQLGSTLLSAFQTENNGDTVGDGEDSREVNFVLAPRSMDNLAAARAVEHVHMFYEVSEAHAPQPFLLAVWQY